ncbi:hypothetical protein Tco_0053222 [Tanacetum coccineum]
MYPHVGFGLLRGVEHHHGQCRIVCHRFRHHPRYGLLDFRLPREDFEDGLVDYPADGGNGDDDDSSDDEEEEEKAEEEEEEHLAPAESVVAPVVHHVPSSEETEPGLFVLPMGRLRASSPSTHHPLHPSPPLPPPPSSLHLPPHVPMSLPLPSSPLLQLPASLFIPPLVDRREDTPEAELPPRKRLCLTALTSRTRHKRQYDRRMNERQMQSRKSKDVLSKALDASLVVQNAVGQINDQMPSAEVHLTAQHNILANGQQHTDQSEPSYDTHLLEKVDSNTTPDSTNMSHRGKEIDQDAEQDQVKSPLLKAEFLKMNDMIHEKVFANAALKNELRKLKGNSVDTKFAKPSILGKPVLQPLINQSVVRQPNAFKSKRPNFSKPRFASQVNMNSVLSKPVTSHYLSQVREYVIEKPHYVIAPGSSRNSQEESYSLNDMAHNHYLEEARIKTQERNRNSKPSVMPTVRLQNTANGSTPNPKRSNQTSRSLPTSKSSCVTITVVPKADHSRNSSSFSNSKHFFCSTCHKCVFNANHDACITKLLNEVNSRKVKPHKTKNSNNPVEQKSHTQKLGRQIFLGHRFSPKKTSDVYEKTSPRSCLRWKPTGKIFTTVGLKWIPTRKLFDSCTCKVDSEPPNGSNDDITNPYECDQTLNVSAGSLNLSAGLVQNIPSLTPAVPPTKIDWDSFFQPMFDEYFKPPPNVDHPEVPTPVPATSTSSPSSTTVDQDAPSTIDIEKVAVRSSLRSLKPKRTIDSRAKRSSINLIRTLFHITCFSHNVKIRVIIRVLRIILVVLPEHPSDTYVFTMKMEILLEPTSNKLMLGKLGDSDVHTLEDPTLILEILSRRFFLRLNLPDHRSVLTGSGGSSKDGDADTSFQQNEPLIIGVKSHIFKFPPNQKFSPNLVSQGQAKKIWEVDSAAEFQRGQAIDEMSIPLSERLALVASFMIVLSIKMREDLTENSCEPSKDQHHLSDIFGAQDQQLSSKVNQ